MDLRYEGHSHPQITGPVTDEVMLGVGWFPGKTTRSRALRKL
ncbi:hypothetical protein [Planomonospora sp. ID91781]|nr:hypothetical protein [Planomonospora sp. ID91781]